MMLATRPRAGHSIVETTYRFPYQDWPMFVWACMAQSADPDLSRLFQGLSHGALDMVDTFRLYECLDGMEMHMEGDFRRALDWFIEVLRAGFREENDGIRMAGPGYDR